MQSDLIRTDIVLQKNSFPTQTHHQGQIPSNPAVSLPKHEFSGGMMELDEKIESLIYQGEHTIKHGAKRM